MRVLVAGASSVLGLPTLRELVRRGHDTYGLTRSQRHAATIAANGAVPLIGDVFDAASTAAAVRRAAPDVVVSLLITLPRYGPRRVSDYRPTVELWRRGVPNLLEATAASGRARFVAESVIFAYGYGRSPGPVDERCPSPAAATGDPLGRVLDALRTMERRVLDDDRVDGAVLRYGLFHGPAVPTTRLLVQALRWRLPVVPGQGRGVLSWVELSDAARATADAVTHAGAGELYNVTDDEPVAFAEYAATVAAALALPPPRRMPAPAARLVAPLPARFLDAIHLPVRNDKAARELGWRPRYASTAATARLLADELGRR